MTQKNSTPNVFTDDVAKKWLKDLLKTDVVTVIFTKSDGSERSMKATLSEKLIPVVTEAVVSDKPKKERKVSDEVLPVYDTEAQGWRSFRWDSIKQIQFDL